jgi:hypothetical protein
VVTRRSWPPLVTQHGIDLFMARDVRAQCRHQHFVTIQFSSGKETRLNQHLKLLISL